MALTDPNVLQCGRGNLVVDVVCVKCRTLMKIQTVLLTQMKMKRTYPMLSSHQLDLNLPNDAESYRKQGICC